MSFARIEVAGVTMPAGSYWVGDPCYAVPNEDWMPWLEAADYMNERRYLLATIDGWECREVLGIGTAHGDGVYLDQSCREYPVDAGLIGVVPEEICQEGPFGMHWEHFDVPFLCTYTGSGEIRIGHLVIETDPQGDDSWIDSFEDDGEEREVWGA